VDTKSEIRAFLTTRRAKITPEQAGLRTFGGPRRVPGLRREEVAMLAGVSVDYYTRLERGNASGVSETVLDSLARALQLDDVERAHLFDLARPSPRRRARSQIRPALQQLLDAITEVPAFVRNGRLDLLTANRVGRALYAQQFDSPYGPPNSARFVFLDPRATTFFREWERVATDSVATLRAAAGRDPHDRALSDLVGELTTRSDFFSQLWAQHDVHRHDTGHKRFHHPLVGDLDVTFETMELVADPGLTMFVYTAEPGSKSREALDLLASWAATDHEESAHGDHEEQPRDHTRAD
jgi:transcriptional regulator with XRE-family HTH domain